MYFLWELFGAARSRRAARASAAALAAGGPRAPARRARSSFRCSRRSRIPPSTARAGRRWRKAAGASRSRCPRPRRGCCPTCFRSRTASTGRAPSRSRAATDPGCRSATPGAVLFPLAALAFRGRAGAARPRRSSRRSSRPGSLYGASAPGLDRRHRAAARAFALALNYRLVFLAGARSRGARGVRGAEARRRRSAATLAGPRRRRGDAGPRRRLPALPRPVFADRGLPDDFVRTQSRARGRAARDARGARRLRGCGRAARGLRARASLRASACSRCAASIRRCRPARCAPPLPRSRPSRRRASPPHRRGGDDVPAQRRGALPPRGRARLRVARARPLRRHVSAVVPRAAGLVQPRDGPLAGRFSRSSTRGTRSARPDDPVPAGWREQARGRELAIFENPGALPRAFVPRRLRRVADPRRRLAEMAARDRLRADGVAVGRRAGRRGERRGAVELRAVGPDLCSMRASPRPALIATSMPDWPGWRSTRERARAAHARSTTRSSGSGFRPEPRRAPPVPAPSFALGLAAFGRWGLAAPRLLARRRREACVDNADAPARRPFPRRLRRDRGAAPVPGAPLRRPGCAGRLASPGARAAALHGPGAPDGRRLRSDRHPLQRRIPSDRSAWSSPFRRTARRSWATSSTSRSRGARPRASHLRGATAALEPAHPGGRAARRPWHSPPCCIPGRCSGCSCRFRRRGPST